MCRVCGRKAQTRMGVCFDCVWFESLIDDRTDMNDYSVKREIEGSESLNILYQIIKTYGER